MRRRFEQVDGQYFGQSVMGPGGYQYPVIVGADGQPHIVTPATMQQLQQAGHRGLDPNVFNGGGAVLQLGPPADWRQGQLAPGVNAPGEGLVPLPMRPDNGTGIFGATSGQITWTGSLQKPFRAERFLCQVVRTGTTAIGILTGQIFVGTDLQSADITPLPLELIGTANSFDTRLSLVQAPPGVLIRIQASVTPAPASSDTVTVAMMFLGAVIH